MKISARKWLVAAILLAASGLGLWGLAAPRAGGSAQAAAPVTWGAASSLGSLSVPPPDRGVRRENAPPVQGPPPRTGPASPFNPLVPPNWGPNYRANTDPQTPTNFAQQEPSIAVNPTNPLNVVAMAKDERAGSNTKHDWIYTSTDGGVTWINQQFPLRSPISPFDSDPVVNFSDDGICYVTSLPYGGGAAGIQVARSTDGGITFGPASQVTDNGGADKEWTWIDNFPSSPFYHRVYVAWMDFAPGFKVTYSTDRGDTWTTSAHAQSAYQFPMPVVLPNGNLIVTYRTSGGTNSFIRSTDGGVTFSAAQTIAASVPNPSCPPDNAGCGIWRLSPIPANSVNPVNGVMVLVWADNTGGTATVRYSRSTNNGTSWSAAAVLAPPGVAGTYQVEPWVEADEQGTFHAIWYDDRENPNTSIFNIYYSQSTDDGATWSTAVRISTATSDLRIGIPSSYGRAAGDYIQVTASHGNVYAAWTDTRQGSGEDIYVVRGTYGGGTPTPTATGTPPTATPCPPSFAGVQISDFMFSPQTVTVYTGATVRWTNFGPTVHTSTSDTGVWDSGNIAVNDFYQRTFDTPGVYPYHCAPHPGMTGTITVLAGCPPTNTPTRTVTSTRTNTPTNTPTFAVTPPPPTRSHTPTNTPSNTPTNPAGLTNTPTGTATSPTTPNATSTPTGIATPCVITFTDVGINDYFYNGVTWLYCHGAISGYGDGTFKPYNNTTRGQMVKIVVLAYGIATYTPPAPTFNDVPTDNAFYQFVETAAHSQIVSGYTCGGAGEPCPGMYFRPNGLVTRGQLSKIIVGAAGWSAIDPNTATFNDVPRGSTFYTFIETAFCHQIISGYDCGGPGEPCPGKYFRSGNNATRGQIAKIVYEAILNHPCQGQAPEQGR